MNIATLILTHDNPTLTADTVDSVHEWVGDRTLTLVDQIGWSKFQKLRIGSRTEEGLYHGCKKSPYRNYALGLKKLYQYWPDSDWFLYTEYDCLFISDAFKEDLVKAENRNAWIVGVDMRRFNFELPVLQNILDQGTIKYSYYFLGCCQFLHRKFLDRMHEIGFLDKLLECTKDFKGGIFPDYHRWAFEEELWPTVAAQLGGSLYELVCWKGGGEEWQYMKHNDPQMLYAGAEHDKWRGKFKVYPVRNAPEVDTEDIKPETSIVHPIKTLNHIRRFSQDKRREVRKHRFLL